MSVAPKTPIGDCPNCGGSPRVERKGLFVRKVRMTCRCGVSGAWMVKDTQPYPPVNYEWHTAARGWTGISVFSDTPKPPSSSE